MSNESKATKLVLSQAGWREGRSVDTSAYEQLLWAEGYTFFPVIREFLKEFGGLRFVNKNAKPPAVRDWHFVVEEAVKHAVPAKVLKYYSKRAGTELCVIGEAVDGYLLLMMDQQGRMFGGYDQEFFLISDSCQDIITDFCEGRQFRKVGGEEST